MRLIRLPEVLLKTGYSRSRIYADASFPQRVKIGARSVAWSEEEVDQWIAERMAARQAQEFKA